jgi:Mg-chelatase subunit ChlD
MRGVGGKTAHKAFKTLYREKAMRWLLGSLLFLLCSSLTVALVCTEQQTASYLTAGTTYTFNAKNVDYVIVVDRSGSMQGAKIEKVRYAAKELVKNLQPTDRAALISFNYEAQISSHLTSDHEFLSSSVDTLSASFSTKYAPPLLLTQEELASSPHEKVLIFLSDGKSDFSESPEEILSLTQSLAEDDVCIFTIAYALGGEENPLLEAMAKVGEENGCGQHFTASEQGTELAEVFTHIYDVASSTNAITLHSTFQTDHYAFTFTSRFNEKMVPGESAGMCIEAPTFRMHVYEDKKLVRVYTEPQGTLSLPPGTYNYEATATVRCGGACGFVGEHRGTFSIGDTTCVSSYQDLASYVTGETQQVRITPLGFTPSSIAGRQGTLVIWNNEDTVSRHLVSNSFDTIIPAGESFTYVIEQVGTLLYSDPEHNLSATVNSLDETGNDILLIIDESGSMKGARIAETRQAAQEFFSLLSPNDRIALITFSNEAYLLQDFTTDRTELYAATASLRAEGSTSYLAALREAGALRPKQHSVIIFMSDGVPTDGDEETILALTQTLRERGWCIMTVGFGEEGVKARGLLMRMAGTDRCSAFLYASEGSLSQTFGTIYQLSKSQEDIVFNDLRIPRVTFKSTIPLSARLQTKTGKPLPATTSALCTPQLLVQARTDTYTVQLNETENVFAGTIPLHIGAQKVMLLASVSAEDEPTRSFIGVETVTVYRLPLWLVAVAILLSAILIYCIIVRRR